MHTKQPTNVTEDPITVNVTKGQGYVWDAADAIKLREEHRVHGVAVGTLANHNTQNQVPTKTAATQQCSTRST